MKTKLSAVDGIEKRYSDQIAEWVKNQQSHLKCRPDFIEKMTKLYEKATWIDANLKGGCVVDPYFGFHFYEEEDAVAFKLKWEKSDGD